MSTGREIRLVEEDDGRWSAIDEETLEMLDEAVALHKGEVGESVTDEDLRELGIDPESAPDGPEDPDAPWFGSDE